MAKFETYPETTTLNDNDITLYNRSTITHKITFGNLLNLIKNRLQASGMVTSVGTGAGLLGGPVTSSGVIKCNLK